MTSTDAHPESEAAIRIEGVSKAFGDTPVLRDLHLSFERHRVTALVGASGCGKSTLLRLCNGLLVPDTGTVEVLGRRLETWEMVALRRRIGYAVQGSALFPHLNARDNMTLAARLARWSSDELEERIETLCTLMHVNASLLDRHPHQLSGGQQQRVGLCRAMMLRPDILLLDEPFAAIDPITRYEIHQQVLSALEKEPLTVLLVTHDMREAFTLADDIVVMHDGRITHRASADTLLAQRPDLAPEQLLKQLLEENR